MTKGVSALLHTVKWSPEFNPTSNSHSLHTWFFCMPPSLFEIYTLKLISWHSSGQTYLVVFCEYLSMEISGNINVISLFWTMFQLTSTSQKCQALAAGNDEDRPPLFLHSCSSYSSCFCFGSSRLTEPVFATAQINQKRFVLTLALTANLVTHRWWRRSSRIQRQKTI